MLLCKVESIPLIVTAVPPNVAALVATPELLTTRPPASAIDTTVPASLPGSGLALGKDVLLATGTNPPTSLSKLTT